MTYIDLEKTYNIVPRKLIWRTLRNKYISNEYIKIIQDIYDGTTTNVRTVCGETTEFPVGVAPSKICFKHVRISWMT